MCDITKVVVWFVTLLPRYVYSNTAQKQIHFCGFFWWMNSTRKPKVEAGLMIGAILTDPSVTFARRQGGEQAAAGVGLLVSFDICRHFSSPIAVMLLRTLKTFLWSCCSFIRPRLNNFYPWFDPYQLGVSWQQKKGDMI